MKGLIQLFFGILLIATGKWFIHDGLGSDLISSGVILIASLIVLDGSFFILDHRNHLRPLIQSLNPFVRRELRISIAYLMRIEVNGRYLLIKNDRGQQGFQPVGGVYKYFNPEGYNELQKLGIFTDNNVDVDEHSEHDLRCTLQNRCKLFKFLKWFKTGKNRELDPWREFHEELIRPEILSEDIFRHIQYEKVASNIAPIRYSEHFKTYEFLYADIFRPKFNAVQLQALQQLARSGHPDICFASRHEIIQGNSGTNLILPHTKKIFTV